MRVLLLPDKKDWAYFSIAKNLVKYNADDNLELDIIPIKKNQDKIKKKMKKYDRFLVMGWQTYDLVNFLPKDETLIGVHSHHAWDNKQTLPDNEILPDKKLVAFLNGFLKTNFVSDRLYQLFKKSGCSNGQYTPNGVDSEMFKYTPQKDKSLVVGYSGSKSHDWRKGVSKYIQPAAKKANVECKIAMLSTGTHIALEEMPKFYEGIDVYICASASEGFSLSVLEASSCGCPIISTRVGGCTDLINHGINGFLVDRTVEAIAEKIELLKNFDIRNQMSLSMRRIIEDEYCWKHKAQSWIDFIKD